VAEASPVSGEELKRAEEFAREPFVLEGEDPSSALAEDGARRVALNAALKEIDEGRSEPSVEWRRDYSLILGLERLLSEDEPHLVDGTTLSAHQVDALSGTLIALESELLIGRPGNGNGKSASEELHSGEVEIEGDELPDEEPLDWDPAEEAEEEAAADAQEEDSGAARRFWFEHATGAGKTVAALGFVEASRTGGILILTHRRNLVDQFLGELRDRGYKKRISGPLLKDSNGEPPAARSRLRPTSGSSATRARSPTRTRS
jgi:ribonuclease E